MRPPSLTTDGARSILRRLSDDSGVAIDHPKHDSLAPHGGRRGMGEVLVRAFGYTVAVRYLYNSEEMIRERYSHIEAGELGDVATEALAEFDGDIEWERRRRRSDLSISRNAPGHRESSKEKVGTDAGKVGAVESKVYS